MKQQFSSKNSGSGGKAFICTSSRQGLTCKEISGEAQSINEKSIPKPLVNSSHQLTRTVATNRDKGKSNEDTECCPDKCLTKETEVVNETVTLTLDLSWWDPVNLVRTSLNQPFDVQIQVRKQGTLVTLSIPTIQFDLRVSGNPVQGFVYTLPGTNLPKDLWPAQLLGESFVVPGQNDGLEYGLTVGTDGALTWGSPDSGGISAMPAADGHRIAPTTVSYLLPICKLEPPKNVKFSQGSTIIVGAHTSNRDLLEYYANDIQRDQNTGIIRAAWLWPDNSGGGAPPRNFANLKVKTSIVNPTTGVSTYSPAVQLTNAGNNQFYIEAKVAINPTNIDNIVVCVLLFDNNFSGLNPLRRRVVLFSSFDGGVTWSSVEPFSPTDERKGDMWVVFDTFGNCFCSIVTIPNASSGGPGYLQIRASTNGGVTFPTQIANVITGDVPGGGFPDSPKCSVGPDGTGTGNLALWFCGDDANNTLNITSPLIGYVPVTGLGSYGPSVVVRSFTEIPSGQGIGVSQIKVNPSTGAVYFFSTNLNDESGLFNTLSDASLKSLWVNPKGIVGFGSDSFLPRRDIMIGNMNDNTGGIGHTLPWQPNRGVHSQGISCSAYDTLRNRLYYLGTDMRPNLSNENAICITYSTNEGQTWSNQFIVNQRQDVSAGMCTIAVEPSTGIVAVGFFSPQNDPVNQEYIDYYGFTIPAPNIPGGCKQKVFDAGLRDLALTLIAPH